MWGHPDFNFFQWKLQNRRKFWVGFEWVSRVPPPPPQLRPASTCLIDDQHGPTFLSFQATVRHTSQFHAWMLTFRSFSSSPLNQNQLLMRSFFSLLLVQLLPYRSLSLRLFVRRVRQDAVPGLPQNQKQLSSFYCFLVLFTSVCEDVNRTGETF